MQISDNSTPHADASYLCLPILNNNNFGLWTRQNGLIFFPPRLIKIPNLSHSHSFCYSALLSHNSSSSPNSTLTLPTTPFINSSPPREWRRPLQQAFCLYGPADFNGLNLSIAHSLNVGYICAHLSGK